MGVSLAARAALALLAAAQSAQPLLESLRRGRGDLQRAPHAGVQADAVCVRARIPGQRAGRLQGLVACLVERRADPAEVHPCRAHMQSTPGAPQAPRKAMQGTAPDRERGVQTGSNRAAQPGEDASRKESSVPGQRDGSTQRT